MFLIDGHLDLSMNALEWNRDLTRPLAEVRQREAGKTDKVDRGTGRLHASRNAPRRDRPVHRHADRPLCRAEAIRCPAGTRRRSPGPDAGAARLVSGDGRRRRRWCRSPTGRHSPSTWRCGRTSPPAEMRPIGYILSLEGADSIVNLSYLETGLRQRPAGDRPGPLRPRPLSPRHRRGRRPDASRPRAGQGDAAARHRPRRDAPDRRRLLGSPRPLRRPRLGQPQQLPGARAAPAAVQRRPAQGTDPPRCGDRRGVRRLDDGPRLDPRQNDAARDGRARSTRSSTTSTTSASSPARRGTAPSAPTSTAATAPSRRRWTSTPSPTCKRSPESLATPRLQPRRHRRYHARELDSQTRRSTSHMKLANISSPPASTAWPASREISSFRSISPAANTARCSRSWKPTIPTKRLSFCTQADDQIPLAQVQLLPPIDQQEVWAAGVTYKRSQTARMEESDGRRLVLRPGLCLAAAGDVLQGHAASRRRPRPAAADSGRFASGTCPSRS